MVGGSGLVSASAGCIADTESEVDDTAELLGSAIVFENPDRVFKWKATCPCDGRDVVGRFLDLTRPPDDQDGLPTQSSIEVLREDSRYGILAAGGLWFRSAYDTSTGPDSAFFAAGAQFVIEGVADPDRDLLITPPRRKRVGDTVGPADTWVNGEPAVTYGHSGVQAAHFQDNSAETGADQVWFRRGMVGVRFRYQGGIHYGFVELRFVEVDPIELSRYLVLRWGYNPVADEPLVIP
jgi:hypothetical protein